MIEYKFHVEQQALDYLTPRELCEFCKFFVARLTNYFANYFLKDFEESARTMKRAAEAIQTHLDLLHVALSGSTEIFEEELIFSLRQVEVQSVTDLSDEATKVIDKFTMSVHSLELRNPLLMINFLVNLLAECTLNLGTRAVTRMGREMAIDSCQVFHTEMKTFAQMLLREFPALNSELRIIILSVGIEIAILNRSTRI